MYFNIDMHNFSNKKEYIRRTFPKIFGQTYDHRHLTSFAKHVSTPKFIPIVQHSGKTHQLSIVNPIKNLLSRILR